MKVKYGVFVLMMNSQGNILCTVVMPCYNAREYIGKSIQSVRDQVFESWELIIVDDGSSDDSVTLVRENYCSVDDRIRLVQLRKNAGAAAARNKAIELAQGRFIAFLDSDDTWTPDKLETQLAFMEKHGYAFTYTAYRRLDDQGNFLNDVGVPESVTYHQLLKTNVIGCLSAVYDTQKLGKVYMPLIRKRQDFGLWLRILKLTPRAYGLNRSLAFYTVREGSVSANKAQAAQYTWRLYREVEGLSRIRSVYYFSHYMIRGVLRTRYPGIAERLGLLN